MEDEPWQIGQARTTAYRRAILDSSYQHYLSIDWMSIFSHAAPYNHLLTECVFPPYNGLPEPVWILQLQNSGQGRVPYGTGRRRENSSRRGGTGVYRSTLHIWGAPGGGPWFCSVSQTDRLY